ncbi:MAG: Ribosomal protein [Parcubacteria group bacterium]|nr:Ribosomal protein [Parcubacteria group bacterium]
MSTTEDRAERTVYEIGYLVLPSIPEESLPDVVSKITNTFEKAGGEKLDGEDPFLYELSYEISKQVGARKYVVHEAYLGWIKFELEASAIEAVKAELDKTEELLRFLLIKVPTEAGFTFAAARAALEEKMNPTPVEEVSAAAETAPEAPKEAVVE